MKCLRDAGRSESCDGQAVIKDHLIEEVLLLLNLSNLGGYLPNLPFRFRCLLRHTCSIATRSWSSLVSMLSVEHTSGYIQLFSRLLGSPNHTKVGGGHLCTSEGIKYSKQE